jgi:hypothetical protein
MNGEAHFVQRGPNIPSMSVVIGGFTAKDVST